MCIFQSKFDKQKTLFSAIIKALPNDFAEIKSQTLSGWLYGLDKWDLFPEYKFTTMGYGGEKVFQYKKRGKNYKISGIQIFSNVTNKFEDIEILIKDNLVSGLKITNSHYQLKEFDINKITIENINKSDFIFPPDSVEIFYNKLDK